LAARMGWNSVPNVALFLGERAYYPMRHGDRGNRAMLGKFFNAFSG
jgi:hypothetical protein